MSVDLSPEGLVRYKKLADAATGNVWRGYLNHKDHIDGCINCGQKHIALCNVYDIPGKPNRVTVKERQANTAYIAAVSPAFTKAVCKEIQTLRKALAQEKAKIEDLKSELQNLKDTLESEFDCKP